MRYGVERLLTLICLLHFSISAPIEKDNGKTGCQCRKKLANPYDILNLQSLQPNAITTSKSMENNNLISKMINSKPVGTKACTCGNNCRCQSHSNLLLPWMVQSVNSMRSPRLVKVYQTKIVEEDTQPFNILESLDFGFWKSKDQGIKNLKKRDITGEYNLLEQEHQQTDWTSPDITQYMPETLRKGFDHSKMFCNQCESRNNYKQKRNATVNELETDKANIANKRSAESASNPAERNADITSKLELERSMPSTLVYVENFQGSQSIDKYLGQILENAKFPPHVRSAQNNDESEFVGQVNSQNYADDHWGHVIRNIVDKYQDFNDASIPIEDQELYNLKFYAKLIAKKF